MVSAPLSPHPAREPVPVRASQLEPSRSEPLDEWPWLGRDVLLPTRSRRVCMTCHWFRHHASGGGIPQLTCQRHQALLAHGEHLTHRCTGWTDDLHRQRGWAPEVA